MLNSFGQNKALFLFAAFFSAFKQAAQEGGNKKAELFVWRIVHGFIGPVYPADETGQKH